MNRVQLLLTILLWLDSRNMWVRFGHELERYRDIL